MDVRRAPPEIRIILWEEILLSPLKCNTRVIINDVNRNVIRYNCLLCYHYFIDAIYRDIAMVSIILSRYYNVFNILLSKLQRECQSLTNICKSTISTRTILPADPSPWNQRLSYNAVCDDLLKIKIIWIENLRCYMFYSCKLYIYIYIVKAQFLN